MNKLFRVTAIFFLSMIVQSCSTSNFFQKDNTVLQALNEENVSVMRLGDSVTIVIPSHALFEGYSVKISSSGKEILEQVTKLLQPMNKVKMTVAAYAEATTQTKKDLMMTQWQAEAVSHYFWDNHIDARLIYAVGYGGGHPVQYETNQAMKGIVGDRENYRVEITLKDYVQ